MINTGYQKNILIVDFGHLEVVSSFLILYESPQHNFFVITLPWLAKEIEDSGFKNITTYTIEYHDVEQVRLVRDIYFKCKIDLVVLTTLEIFIPEYDNLFRQLKVELWVYIHNANFWFNKQFGFLPRNRLQFKLLSLAKRANRLVVLDNRIKDFIETNFKISKLIVIPTSISVFTPFQRHSARIRIVLPGNIQEKRRDYNLLLQLIPLINHLKIDLILLGKVVDQFAHSVLYSARKFETSSFKVFSFDAYIPQIQYDEELAKADIIFAPIKKETDFFGIEELYGSTKFTGIYADVIRHRKPVIAPSDVQVPIGYELACSYYNNIEDIIVIIKNISLGNNVDFYSKNALKASTTFNVDIIKNKLDVIF